MIRSASSRLSVSLLSSTRSRQVCGDLRVMNYGTFQEKERAEETIHFRKEDERLLRKLLKKVKSQADEVDKNEAASHEATEKDRLKKILGEKVTDAQIEALLGWKHEEH